MHIQNFSVGEDISSAKKFRKTLLKSIRFILSALFLKISPSPFFILWDDIENHSFIFSLAFVMTPVSQG